MDKSGDYGNCPIRGHEKYFHKWGDASSIPTTTSTIERLLKTSIATKPMVAMCGVAMCTKMLRHQTETTITTTMMGIIISDRKIIKTKNLQGENKTIKTSIILI